jgi:hypothetical protein
VRRTPCTVALILCALAALWVSPTAGAESALRLSRPERYGDIAAQTFDETGRRIGDAHLRIAQLPNGDVSLLSESRIDGGAANRLTAQLAPVDGGAHLRPLTEESHTDLSGGSGLGFLRVDHAARLLRCTPPEGEPVELALPEGERVALAPMNLLFLPLVRGETDEVAFQVAMCQGGPRIVDAKARLAPHPSPDDAAGRLVEVRYELDFGPVLSSIVKPFLPRFSLWFERAAPGDWMASRMPFYARGPTVLVVRAGLSPDSLGLDR